MNEIAFTSSRKRMTTIHRIPQGGYRIVTKGAPDVLLNYCSKWKTASGEEVLTPALRQKIQRKNEEMAPGAAGIGGGVPGYRANTPGEAAEQGLVFCGLIGMIDPPREEVAKSVALCKSAGIRTVMITGDHLATARAIAKQLGILEKDTAAMTGAQLDTLSQRELEKNIYRYSVYARVSRSIRCG